MAQSQSLRNHQQIYQNLLRKHVKQQGSLIWRCKLWWIGRVFGIIVLTLCQHLPLLMSLSPLYLTYLIKMSLLTISCTNKVSNIPSLANKSEKCKRCWLVGSRCYFVNLKSPCMKTTVRYHSVCLPTRWIETVKKHYFFNFYKNLSDSFFNQVLLFGWKREYFSKE